MADHDHLRAERADEIAEMFVELDLGREPIVEHTETAPAMETAEQEHRLEVIVAEAERHYRYFLRCELLRARRPRNPPWWRQIGIKLGPRAQLWSEQNAGAPYHWEETGAWHPCGHVHLEGTTVGDGDCQAWPTQRVRQAIRDGWLLYIPSEDYERLHSTIKQHERPDR